MSLYSTVKALSTEFDFQSLFKNSHNSFRLLQPQLTQDLCCHLALLDHAFRISRLPTPTFRPLHTSRLINSSPPINIFITVG
ncbi:hypothetical protein PCANC_19261 [Puccinia coronata f. sp. avenae]|uniref:Uncharacterized protein n=1 Tax=Puccinia coronata f. sp. avenae TaxID=200324 RepID=A0A2N5UFF9_9BASI|nr:hypothetical protein PCANC_19261 [Puccinia coronata f. sp. avenae]